MSSGAGAKADDRLNAKIDSVGQSIDRRDLFYFLMYMMLENAPKNREQFDFYPTEQDAITIRLISLWNRVSPRPGTHLPYIMDRADMISFLADLPMYLLRKNRFGEMNVAINESGVLIAHGLFRKKIPSGGLSGITSNRNLTDS